LLGRSCRRRKYAACTLLASLTGPSDQSPRTPGRRGSLETAAQPGAPSPGGRAPPTALQLPGPGLVSAPRPTSPVARPSSRHSSSATDDEAALMPLPSSSSRSPSPTGGLGGVVSAARPSVSAGAFFSSHFRLGSCNSVQGAPPPFAHRKGPWLLSCGMLLGGG
jgi:hypothetical protein